MFYNTVGINMTEIPARLYIFSSYFKRKQNLCKKPPSMVGPSHLRGRSPLLRGQDWFFFLFFLLFTLEVYLVLGGGGCVFVCFCPHGMQDLSSLTRDGTHAPCTGSMES